MLAGIKFVDKSQADQELEEERKLLKKQKKKLKKVLYSLMRVSCDMLQIAVFANAVTVHMHVMYTFSMNT